MVAAGSGDWQKLNEKGQVTVWEVKTGKKLWSQPAHIGLVWSVAFSPDNQRLISGGGEAASPGDIKLWDSASGQEIRNINQPKGVVQVAFSPDGNAWPEQCVQWALSRSGTR